MLKKIYDYLHNDFFFYYYRYYYRVRRAVMKKRRGAINLPPYTKDKKSETLLKKEFRLFCEKPFNTHLTFSDMLSQLTGINIKELRERKKLTDEERTRISTFNRKTQLNGMVNSTKLFRECANNLYLKPEMRTLISIAIGLQLDKSEINILLASAGRKLEPIDEVYRAYLFLLEKDPDELQEKAHVKKGKSHPIDACNLILYEIGIAEIYYLGKRDRQDR